METISPEFIAIVSVGIILLSTSLILARLLFTMLRHFHVDMGRRIDETNDRMDKRFDETNKRIDETNSRMERQFDKVDKRFEGVDKRFDKVDKRFEDVEKRLENVEGTLVVVCDRLGWVEGTLNKHRNSTRKAATAG